MNKKVVSLIIACAMLGSTACASVTASANENVKNASAASVKTIPEKYSPVIDTDDEPEYPERDEPVVRPYFPYGDLTYTVEDDKVIIVEISESAVVVDIPDTIDGMPVVAIDSWSYCPDLEKITIPANVTDIALSTFQSFSGLREIVVDENNRNYSSDEGVLFNKEKTELITCPVNKQGEYTVPDGIKNINPNAFYGSNLEKVVLPESLEKISEYAFTFCGLLEDISIPENVQVISDFAFAECVSLESLRLPKSVETLGQGVFASCTALTDFSIDEDNENYCYENGAIYSKDKHVLVNCIGSFEGKFTVPESVGEIANYAFCVCTNITEIELPENPIRFGIGAFSGCTALEHVNIPDGVEELADGTFQECSNLAEINIPDSVKVIGQSVFEYCTKLTSVVLPEGITEIPGWCFSGCTNLRSVNIPSTVKVIDISAFTNCQNLKSISIPAATETLDLYSFSGCSKLEEINIDDENEFYTSDDGVVFNKSKTELLIFPNGKEGDYVVPDTVQEFAFNVFYNAGKLTSITLPDSITYLDDDLFYGCSELRNVTLPSKLKEIPGGIFCYCTSLENVEIPETVTSIGSTAFYNCESLKSLYIPASVKEIDESAFWGCDSLTLLVDEGSYAEKYAKYYQIPYKSLMEPPKLILGDVDGDGEITSADALFALRQSVKLENLTPEAIKMADIDNDGEITSADSLSILRMSVGLEN